MTLHKQNRQRQLEIEKQKELARRSRVVVVSAIAFAVVLAGLFLLTRQYHGSSHVTLKVAASLLLAATAYGFIAYSRLPLCLKCGHRGRPHYKHLDLNGKPDKRFRTNALLCSGCHAPAAENLI